MSAVSNAAWHETAGAQSEMSLECTEILCEHEFYAEKQKTKMMKSIVREALQAHALHDTEAREWMLRVLRESQPPDISGGLGSLAVQTDWYFSEDRDSPEGLDSGLAGCGSVLLSGEGFADFYDPSL